MYENTCRCGDKSIRAFGAHVWNSLYDKAILATLSESLNPIQDGDNSPPPPPTSFSPVTFRNVGISP